MTEGQSFDERSLGIYTQTCFFAHCPSSTDVPLTESSKKTEGRRVLLRLSILLTP